MSEKQTSETWGNLPQRKHVYRGEDLLYKLQALKADNAELKSIIKELITVIEQSSFCKDCQDEFGTLACSECPWAQARDRGKEWVEEE